MKLEDIELIARHRLTTWTKMWLIVFSVHSTHKNKKKKDREIERKKKEGRVLVRQHLFYFPPLELIKKFH